MSKSYYAESVRDILLLIARILLMLLFLIFGWRKLTDYGGTVANFAQGAVPLPALAGVIAIVAEPRRWNRSSPWAPSLRALWPSCLHCILSRRRFLGIIFGPWRGRLGQRARSISSRI